MQKRVSASSQESGGTCLTELFLWQRWGTRTWLSSQAGLPDTSQAVVGHPALSCQATSEASHPLISPILQDTKNNTFDIFSWGSWAPGVGKNSVIKGKVHWFIQFVFWLSTYSVPGTVLGAEYTAWDTRGSTTPVLKKNLWTSWGCPHNHINKCVFPNDCTKK